MQQETLNNILDKVRQAIPRDEPLTTAVISISLGDKRKPLHLINSKKVVGFIDMPFGIVLSYSADPRNLHDREIYFRLQENSMFIDFNSEPYKHDGQSYQKYFGLNINSILETVKNILLSLDGIASFDISDVVVSSYTANNNS